MYAIALSQFPFLFFNTYPCYKEYVGIHCAQKEHTDHTAALPVFKKGSKFLQVEICLRCCQIFFFENPYFLKFFQHCVQIYTYFFPVYGLFPLSMLGLYFRRSCRLQLLCTSYKCKFIVTLSPRKYN